MSWNLPPGCSQSDIDRAYGYDQPDRPNIDAYDEEIESMTISERMNQLREDLKKAKEKYIEESK